MKLETYTKILHSFLVLGIVLGMVPVFGFASISKAKIGHEDVTGLQFNNIIVTENAGTPLFSVAISNTGQETCTQGRLIVNNFVQDTGVLNLNQPAECFSLALGKVVTQGRLAVDTFTSHASISVSRQPQNFQTPELHPLIPGSVPVLLPTPVAASIILTLLFVVLLLLFRYVIRNLEIPYFSFNRLHFLCMQRC